ncbi:NAD-dependent epimerase/dehydratase family protein [Kineococcus sp. SYSU DK001]|uniref:NAD-dependent epimerase/dehydratase family protein n=1 Tax=Kineococcus sp. SYSU DK001 TaxID=3383122 RepID=UPI003D7D49F7
MRVAVTGSTGKLGTATVERLRAGGHDVVGLDLVGRPGPEFTRVDLTDYGQTLDAFLGITARHRGLDAVVHLAAVPVNGLVPDVTTFHTNVTASFNVLHAAHRAGTRRVVCASSITAMGFPFEEAPPHLPLDESCTAANNTYGLGKVVEEALHAQFARWDRDLSLTALRFTNVVAPGEYGTFARAAEPDYRRDLLGSYVDARDGAQAVDLALSAGEPGAHLYVVAAPDSGHADPSAELAARWFPGTPLTRELGEHESLLDTTRIRTRLGFAAAHRWREEFTPTP